MDGLSGLSVYWFFIKVIVNMNLIIVCIRINNGKLILNLMEI